MSLGNDVANILIGREPALQQSLLPHIGTIVSTACLAHDMGNPPFGHSGEKAIQAFFTEGGGAALRSLLTPEFWSDITHFEGNANAFRLLTHRFKGRRDGGFVMTYATLAAIVKYPFSSMAAGKKGKFGFFGSEQAIYERIAQELGIRKLSAEGEPLRYARHPLVYLVEAADDICYEIMDIEDSHKLKILTFDETADMLLGFFEEHDRQQILRRITDEGIYLTGGTARIPGIERYLSRVIGCRINLSSDYEFSTVRGLEELIRHKELKKWAYSIRNKK